MCFFQKFEKKSDGGCWPWLAVEPFWLPADESKLLSTGGAEVVANSGTLSFPV